MGRLDAGAGRRKRRRVGTDGPKTTHVPSALRLERPKLVVLSGEATGREFPLDRFRVTVGSGEGADIRLPDVAALHLELVQEAEGIRAVDLSGGRTRVNETELHSGIIEPNTSLDLGGVWIRIQESKEALSVLPSERDTLGDARARSLVMREIFGMVEAVAPTDATVLLLGETGTGKDVLARAIHGLSPRAGAPLQTVDCGAIAPTLIESELFGYERGAFTGAEQRTQGAFERAQGGTVFLDEIGELPLDVQPKLLRGLEERRIQRVGSSESFEVDVRIVAATKRDLREEVRRGRFREDLWFRLAVLPLYLPPLRDRREDIPVLVETFIGLFERKTGHRAEVPPEEVSRLQAHEWPGNVRELKNTVERALWLAHTGDGVARFMLEPRFEEPLAAAEPEFDPQRSFSDHKQDWETQFERSYLGWLLARADGSISKAARLAAMDRKHLRHLLRKHALYEAPETEA